VRTGRPRTGNTKPCAHCRKPVYRHERFRGALRFCGFACRNAFIRSARVNEKDGTARCSKCKEWKKISEFVKGSGDWPHTYCKPCSAAWFVARRAKKAGKLAPIDYVYRHKFRLTEEEKREKKYWSNKKRYHQRRAIGRMPGKPEIERLYVEQEGRCAYCRDQLDRYHIDHKIPVARGGTNEIENLHLTCGRCNMRKHTLTHEEFLVSKRRRAASWG